MGTGKSKAGGGGSSARNTSTLSSVLNSIEQSIKNSTSEQGFILDAKGNIVKRFGGDEQHVFGSKEDIANLEGMVFTHNHPNGATFSTTDIRNGIVSGNLKELRAVTPNGDKFVLKNNGASLNDRRNFGVQFSQTRMRIENYVNRLVSRGFSMDKNEYMTEQLNKWMTDHAKEYNFGFSIMR